MSRCIVFGAIVFSLFSGDAFAAQTCVPDGDVRFVCGTVNPEDLYQIPDTPWVIASGRVSDVAGPIYAVDIRDQTSRVIFPDNALVPEHDCLQAFFLTGLRCSHRWRCVPACWTWG